MAESGLRVYLVIWRSPGHTAEDVARDSFVEAESPQAAADRFENVVSIHELVSCKGQWR